MDWPHKAKAETSFLEESHSSTHRTSLASRYPKVTNAPSLNPLPAPASNDGVATRPRLPHETRRLSCGRIDVVNATRHRDRRDHVKLKLILHAESAQSKANSEQPSPKTKDR